MGWWDNIPETAFRGTPVNPIQFQFGRVFFELNSSNLDFTERFGRIFGDCAAAYATCERTSNLSLRIEEYPDKALVRASLSYTVRDGIELLNALFPERGYRVCGHGMNGWSLISIAADPRTPVIAYRGNAFVALATHQWQIAFANFAVATAMAMQPEICFFHGATLNINGRGLFIGGDKGAGKTTLSLTLAARGHPFLGDEYAAIESDSGIIVPFRRTASIRSGLQTGRVAAYVSAHPGDVEYMPDGTRRSRVSVSDLFPQNVARPTPLCTAVFISNVGDLPSAERLAPGTAQVDGVEHLAGALWEQSVGTRTIAILNAFSRAQCFRVTRGGTPDEMADFIEALINENDDDG